MTSTELDNVDYESILQITNKTKKSFQFVEYKKMARWAMLIRTLVLGMQCAQR